MFTNFNFQQILSAFIVLFAVIDIIGAIPIIIDLKDKGKDVNALKATLISFLLLLGFFYAGDILLRLFHVDTSRLPWPALCDLPPIFGDDSRHRDFQEPRADQGSYVGAASIPVASRSGIVHHFIIAPCGICQREYYRSLGTEYAMGLLCCPHDTQGRESLGERRHIPDP